MRVLLIKPSNLSDHIQPSLGLGYLATQIRNEHEVRIVDCIKEQLPGPQLLPVLEEFQPDVVGSQCYSMDLAKLKPVLQTVKDFRRDMITIIGGAHATAACQKPASTTCTWPARSTCSGCRHSGPRRGEGSLPHTRLRSVHRARRKDSWVMASSMARWNVGEA